MTHSLLLAQDASTSDGSGTPLEIANSAIRRLDILNHPDELLSTLGNLQVVWASVLFIVGALCILNGYRWHRRVVFICALMCGLALGKVLSHEMNDSLVVMGALGLLCAVISVPMMRTAVAIFGGMTGAFIGANAWTAFSDSPDSHLAGAAMGFIALGLMSFMFFRFVVIVFTSIGGGAMVVLAGITLLLHVEQWNGAVTDALSQNQLLIPLLVAVVAVTGFVLQQTDSGGGGGEEDAATS